MAIVKWPGLGSVVLFCAASSAFLFLPADTPGDAPDYAAQIELGRPFPELLEPGHLLLRPLGFLLYHTVQAAGLSTSALRCLEWVSAVSAAAGLVVMAALLRNLGVRRAPSYLGGLALGVCYGYWNWAAAGTAVIPSLLFSLLAAWTVTGRAPWQRDLRGAVAGGALAAVGGLFWLLMLLSVPGIMALGAVSASRKKMSCAAAVGVSAGVTSVGILVAAGLGILGLSYADLLRWVSSSGHGVPLAFTMLSPLRAALGATNMVLFSSGAGAEIKQALLGIKENNLSLPLLAFVWRPALVLACYALGLWVVARAFLVGDATTRRLLYCAAIYILPFALFALVWQGSDTERWLGAMPAIVMAVAVSYCQIRISGPRVADRLASYALLAGLLGVFALNLFFVFAPSRGYRHKPAWSLMAALAARTSERDLIVWFGRGLDTQHLRYFGKRQCRDLRTALILERKEDWKEGVIRAMTSTWAQQGRVYLSDRLVSASSPVAFGWIPEENPEPSWPEIQTFFKKLQRTRAFSLQGERFWEVMPPSQKRIK